MQRLVAPHALITVQTLIGVRVHLLPIGEEMRVHERSVDATPVEEDGVGASWHPDQGPGALGEEAPRAAHGDQVAPRVEGVAVSGALKNKGFGVIQDSMG